MKRCFDLGVWLALLLVCVTACDSSLVGGGASSKVTLAEVAVYPNAVALEPGKNPIADTLVKNAQQAAQLGSNLEQKAFTLPKDAAWDQIKKFYGEKLTGWQAVNLPIPDNEVMKFTVWRKGTQSLTVMHLTDVSKKDSFLLLSLSSQ